MARTWMITTPCQYGGIRWNRIDMPEYYCVPVYKDTTGQYTDDECDHDNCVEIPVPRELVIQWFHDTWNIEDAFAKFSDLGYNYEQFLRDVEIWVYEESTCDDTNDLFDWLRNHNYFWKRLD